MLNSGTAERASRLHVVPGEHALAATSGAAVERVIEDAHAELDIPIS